LPGVLSGFEMKRASTLLGPATSALMECMAGCFVKCEEEIHRLNITIDQSGSSEKIAPSRKETLCPLPHRRCPPAGR
jgi:hypothetical protein